MWHLLSMKENRKKQLTDEEIEQKLKRYSSRDLQHTREYLVQNLKNNPDFKAPKGIMLKEDFIEQYHKSREGSILYPNFDFSTLSDIINSRKESVTLICLDEDINGNIIGNYKTTYKDLIISKDNPMKYSRKIISGRRLTQEEFIKRAKEIHGNKYDYSEVEFVNTSTKVKIYCKKCKIFFWQTPSDHIYSKAGCPKCGNELNSTKRATGKEEFIKRSREKFGDKFDYSRVVYKSNRKKVEIYCKECKKYFLQSPGSHLLSKFGCPYCSNKYKNTNKLTKEEFIERAVRVHGNLYNYSKANYIDRNTKILIIDNETGDEFWQVPGNHLSGCGNPFRTDSRGEQFVKTWLTNNIDKKFWNREVIIKNKIIGKNTENVRIDFIITINGKIYWIEYNGEQHYRMRYKSNIFRHYPTIDDAINAFNKQVIRDHNVREYCKKNNIIFIEIPYTYSTYSSVSKVLENIIIDGKNPNDIISIPEIQIYKGGTVYEK